MDKNTIFVRMAISKDSFDIDNSVTGHLQFTNDNWGFRSFAKLLSKDQGWVKAIGCHHQQLALYLFGTDIKVSLMNPLSLKMYIKMNGMETDRSHEKNDLQLRI